MKGKSHLFALFLSLPVFFLANTAHAQLWFPIGGIPVPISPVPTPTAPVAPPPPSMMPPGPPPPGNAYAATGGISEYGSTVTGGTVLATTGTDPMGGPAMAMPESPLTLPPYAPVKTQTDEILSSLYPPGTVVMKPARSYTAVTSARPSSGLTAPAPSPGPSAPGEGPPGAPSLGLPPVSTPDAGEIRIGSPPLGGEPTAGPGTSPGGR